MIVRLSKRATSFYCPYTQVNLNNPTRMQSGIIDTSKNLFNIRRGLKVGVLEEVLPREQDAPKTQPKGQSKPQALKVNEKKQIENSPKVPEEVEKPEVQDIHEETKEIEKPKTPKKKTKKSSPKSKK